MVATQEYLSAVTALYKVAEIKKFDIKEDYNEFKKIPLVNELNDSISSSIHLDLFHLEDKASIAAYETFLTEKATAAILASGSQFPIEDEIQLEQAVEDLSKENLLEFDITRPRPFRSVTRIMGLLRLKYSDIPSLLENASAAQILRLPITNYIFVSTRYVFRHTNVVLLLVMASYSKKNNSIFLGNIFLYEETNPRINSPVRLFLQGLHKYGKPITLHGKTQFLFFYGKVFGQEKKEFEELASKGLNTLSRAIGDELTYEFVFFDDFARRESDIDKKIFI